MLPFNKPYLPSFDKYKKYLERAYQAAWLTNNGPLVNELKSQLEASLGVKHLLPVANGTLALQLAYQTLNLRGNAVTTPFTFIATSSSLKWQGITPLFADVNPDTYNLSPDEVAKKINNKTSAIVPVHVYGNPCDVEAFDILAKTYDVKLVYDASHAFGVKVGNQSVLSYGDATTISFHATKLFHSVEGGAVIFKNADDYERAELMTNFGMDLKPNKDDYGRETNRPNISELGINAKMSEFHAAMGLAILDDIELVMSHRFNLHEDYQKQLLGYVKFPTWHSDSNCTGAFMPVTFDTEDQCFQVLTGLQKMGISVKRYFSPSLNTLEIFNNLTSVCPNSESLTTNTLCLPLYFGMSKSDVITVCCAIKSILTVSKRR